MRLVYFVRRCAKLCYKVTADKRVETKCYAYSNSNQIHVVNKFTFVLRERERERERERRERVGSTTLVQHPTEKTKRSETRL